MFLMPPIRSSVSKCAARYFKLVAVILLFSKIMPTYFCYMLKGLVCIIIIAPLSCQPSSCAKCTKLNMRLFCNIRLISNIKYTFLIRS